MKNLIIAKTFKTPEIKFNSNGTLRIWGKHFIPTEPAKFMDKLYDWVEEYIVDPAAMTEITFGLWFTHRECWQRFMKLIQKICMIHDQQHSVTIKWYVEISEDADFKEWIDFELKKLNVSYTMIEVDEIE